MNSPLFSIIMATYNRRDLLPRAINSVLNQTFEDFELLVIDNGSTDDTGFVVKQFKDSRIRYILNPNPSRSCDAPRNLGINTARGSLIAFLDDDDIWYPQRLEKVKEVFDKNTDVSLVCHNLNIRVNGTIEGVWKGGPWSENLYEVLLYEKNCLGPVATTIKTDILRQVNGFSIDKRFDAVADCDLWLRLAAKNTRMFFIDDVLGEYSFNNTSRSALDPEISAKIAFIIKTHLLKYEKKPIFFISRKGLWRMFQLYFVAGRAFMRTGRCIKALRYYLSAAMFILIKPVLFFDLCAKLNKAKDKTMLKRIVLFLRDSVSFIIYISIFFKKNTRDVVLIYHSVGFINQKDDPYRINVNPKNFERHLKVISRYKNKVEITFDDGYRNNFENAFPLLKKYNLSATVFIITDFIDGKLGAERFAGKNFREEPLTWEQIRLMDRSGIKFGSHSKTHQVLATLSNEDLQREAQNSKGRIEAELDHNIDTFAYPFGGINSFNDAVKNALIKAGYSYAHTNIIGTRLDKSNDALTLRRIRIYSEDGPFRLRMKIKGAYDWVDKFLNKL